MIPALVSAALVHAVAFPSEASCEPGYFAEGVRPDGSTTCRETPPRGLCDTRAGCAEAWEGKAMPMRVWCSRGQVAVVRDYRSITCR